MRWGWGFVPRAFAAMPSATNVSYLAASNCESGGDSKNSAPKQRGLREVCDPEETL
jgi:hypothetical protein